MVVLVVGFWAAAAYFAVRGLQDLHDELKAYVLVGAALLKSTFSVRMLHQAAARCRAGLRPGATWTQRSEPAAASGPW